jgi:hypothetical protein
MIDEDRFDRETWDASATGCGMHPGRRGKTLINGWQIAGVFLSFFLLSPALVSGRAGDGADSLGLTLLSLPLLAWLFIPLRRSDDLFDQTERKRAEAMDVLALILLWTWPWTCAAPFVAIGRCVRILLPGVL